MRTAMKIDSRSQPVLSGCQFTEPKWHEIHIKWVHTKQKYFLNIIITTILQKQENIDIKSLPKSEVFWGNISNIWLLAFEGSSHRFSTYKCIFGSLKLEKSWIHHSTWWVEQVQLHLMWFRRFRVVFLRYFMVFPDIKCGYSWLTPGTIQMPFLGSVRIIMTSVGGKGRDSLAKNC